MLSDFAREFSDGSKRTCSYVGTFRILQDMTYRLIKCRRCCDLNTGLWETWGAAEPAAQRSGRHQEQQNPLCSSAGVTVLDFRHTGF
jgi:hypothetical protein